MYWCPRCNWVGPGGSLVFWYCELCCPNCRCAKVREVVAYQ